MKISQLVLTFLLNASWQIILITVIAAIGDCLLRESPPRYRHNLWVAALFLAFAVPVISCSYLLPEMFSGTTTVPSGSQEIISLNTSSVDDVITPAGIAPFILKLGTNAAMILLGAYFLIVLYRGLRLFRAWQRTRVIAQSGYSASLPAPILAAAAKCYANIGIENISILFSDITPGPVTIGNQKPLIILPESLLDETDENILISAIGHELVHISRRDYVFNLIYELTILPLAFHPAVVMVKRRINETRELCCDANVAGRLLQAEDYARSLVKLAEAAANPVRPALTTTVGMGDVDNLEVRVMSLLKKSESAIGRRNTLMIAGLLMFAIVSLVAGAFGLRVGIVDEVRAQQIERINDGDLQKEDIQKLRQLIEIKAKELSMASGDEIKVQSLKKDIDILKTKLASLGSGRLGEVEIVRKKLDEARYLDEYKAKLAAEQPTLTDDQTKERIEKEIIAARQQLERKQLEIKKELILDYNRQIEARRDELVALKRELESRTAALGDENLKVTKKPRPSARGCEGTGGKAIVRVTFQADGTIGDAVLTEASTCQLFNDSVLQIVKQIEFEPAVKDGQKVTVTKQLEYLWANY